MDELENKVSCLEEEIERLKTQQVLPHIFILKILICLFIFALHCNLLYA